MGVTTVTTEPITDPAAAVSTDRALGRLETETENLSDQVDQISDQVDQISDQVDQTDRAVSSAMETAWDAQAEVARLRAEVDQKFEQLVDLIRSQGEDEDDRESSAETDLIELPEPEAAEPMPEVVKSKFWDLMI